MASIIKVDNVQNTPGTNIVSKCGTTITLGASSDTVALASGASQTGFGRTGTVDWQTGSIKTATFTATNGEGYFCNPAGGSFEVDLPAGSAGAIVSIQDYNNTFDSNSLTVDPNGSEKINGGLAGGIITLSTEGEGVTLVYIDSTVGWRSIHQSTFADTGSNAAFVTATGGSITTVCTNYKVHTFTGPGTFCVSCAGNACGSTTIDYMVIAGGGGGGGQCQSTTSSGGGGAGGYRESPGAASGCYTVSPLGAAPAAALPVTATGYPVTVGAGGAGGAAGLNHGVNGSNSVFAGTTTITSAGGGYGSGVGTPGCSGNPGGSGGGAKQDNNGGPSGGVGIGNTPPVSPSQGMNGGTSDRTGPTYFSGGGGGATVAGGNPSSPGSTTGAGGTGATSSINGTPTQRAGGGGAGKSNYPGSVRTEGPATGGGGQGATTTGTAPSSVDGSDNTGGGGGGAAGSTNPFPNTGGIGGSGVVIIRYKFQ